MEIEKLLGSLAFLILAVWFGKTLNTYSKKKYSYAPIGLRTIFFGMIPYMFLVIGFLFQESGAVVLYVVIILASISITGQFIWILNRSSVMVATGAIVLLTIVGLPTVLFLFFSRKDDYGCKHKAIDTSDTIKKNIFKSDPVELLKWHDLKEKDVITEEEFKEHKKIIMR